MNTQLYLRNALCVPVKGYNRAIIYDITRNDYYFIPNQLYDKIESTKAISFDNDTISQEWKEFLLEEEVIFEIDNSDEVHLFPKLELEYDSPFNINSIIIHDTIDLKFFKWLSSLELSCISILFEKYNPERLENLLGIILDLEINSINIYISEENRHFTIDDFKTFRYFKRPLSIFIFKSSYIDELSVNGYKVLSIPLSFKEFSKKMQPQKLQVNREMFLEASNYHSYFNGKVYIDGKGNIKNGIYSSRSYGLLRELNEDQFNDIILSEDFQKHWNVKKENTLICNNCEFKFMCVDPREPIENDMGKWYFSEECNYNPFLSLWKGESEYKTLGESGISITHTNGISIKENILNELLEKIWD